MFKFGNSNNSNNLKKYNNYKDVPEEKGGAVCSSELQRYYQTHIKGCSQVLMDLLDDNEGFREWYNSNQHTIHLEYPGRRPQCSIRQNQIVTKTQKREIKQVSMSAWGKQLATHTRTITITRYCVNSAMASTPQEYHEALIKAAGPKYVYISLSQCDMCLVELLGSTPNVAVWQLLWDGFVDDGISRSVIT